MTLNYIIVGIYSALLLVGGLIGHLKAGSTASLVTGVVFSLILAYCAYLMFRDESRTALFGAIFVSGILTAFFAYRYLITVSFMPAGLMCILSFLVVAVLLSTQNKLQK